MPIALWEWKKDLLGMSDFVLHIIVVLAWAAHLFEASWTAKRAVKKVSHELLKLLTCPSICTRD